MADHIEITDHVELAGLSAVGKDIKTPGRYGGYPLTPIIDFFKWRSLLPKIPSLLKRVSRLEKTLNKILEKKHK